mgnify:FL=1
MAKGTIEVDIKGLRPTQDLHAAVCSAVALLNCCPEAGRVADVRRAHDMLRQALVDFADASMGEIETPTKPAGPFEWAPAPSRTQWGAGMVLANVEIDRDHTLSIYAEADQAMNVAAALRRALAA